MRAHSLRPGVVRLLVLITGILLLVGRGVIQAQVKDDPADYLVNQTWATDEFQNPKIAFTGSGTFDASFVAMGGEVWAFRGTYTYAGGQAILSVTEKNFSGIGGKAEAPKSCKIFASEADLYFQEEIICQPGKWRFYNITKPVPEGSRKFIGKLPVITMASRRGLTTTNVKLRKKPDVSGAVLPFFESCVDQVKPGCATQIPETGATELPHRRIEYVPQGTALILVARTETMQSVQKWKNYWYFVKATTSSNEITRQGWIFGEFVNVSPSL